MDKLPTTIEVRDQAKRLVALLEDPHPGLATWVGARNYVAAQLYKMLGEVLGKTSETRQLVLDFFAGNEEKTDLWFRSPNPLLGGISPEKMITAGREDRLLGFVQQQLAENEAPSTQ